MLILVMITISLVSLVAVVFSFTNTYKMYKFNKELILENSNLRLEISKRFTQEELNKIIASRLKGY